MKSSKDNQDDYDELKKLINDLYEKQNKETLMNRKTSLREKVRKERHT